MAAYTGGLPTTVIKKGSNNKQVKKLQKFLNWWMRNVLGDKNTKKLKVDGSCGDKTVKLIKRFQKKYGLKIDGIWGETSNGTAKQIIEAYKPKPAPTPADPLQPWFDALKVQYNWSKNQKYHFNEHPTVANSKKEGTCITYPSVSAQRIGILPVGKYFYLNPNTNRISGNGADYVKKHPEIYSVSYPNKTLATLYKEGKIKKGDIVGYDNPNYHTMVFKGKNKKGNFIFDTMGGGKRGLNVEYPYYAKRKVGMIVRIKKVK